jgi:hypothetical protein
MARLSFLENNLVIQFCLSFDLIIKSPPLRKAAERGGNFDTPRM